MPNNEKKRQDATVYPPVVEATAQALKVSVDGLADQTKILNELLGRTNELIGTSNKINKGTEIGVKVAVVGIFVTILLSSVSILLQLQVI